MKYPSEHLITENASHHHRSRFLNSHQYLEYTTLTRTNLFLDENENNNRNFDDSLEINLNPNCVTYLAIFIGFLLLVAQDHWELICYETSQSLNNRILIKFTYMSKIQSNQSMNYLSTAEEKFKRSKSIKQLMMFIKIYKTLIQKWKNEL